jgi:N-acyl-D-aspartate/D-glutamate deacylase
MVEYDLLILNGLVVTDTETGEFDIAIKNEKIELVVSRGSLKDATAKRTIDAEGGYVMVSHEGLRGEGFQLTTTARRRRCTCPS